EATFSPGGDRVATVAGTEVRLWDVRTGTPVAAFPHEGPVTRVQFSPDGRLVASIPGRVGFWRLDWSEGSVWKRMAAKDVPTVRVGEAATGKPVTPPLAQAAGLWSAEFSADGALLLTTEARVVAEWIASRSFRPGT